MMKESPEMTTPSIDELLRENEMLRRRVDEAEAAVRAIRAGEVDAVVVESEQEQVYTLETPDNSYRLLVAQVRQAAATLTHDGFIVSCNRRFGELLGRTESSLRGRPLFEFIAAESKATLDQMLRKGCPEEFQDSVTLLASDGTLVHVHLGVRPIREGALGLCLMITDLTEQRHYEELQRTQEALRASEEALLAADRRKDEFLATLAHELRNPLAPIRNAAQILQAKGPPILELQWARGVIQRQVEVMARLLEDLLDVSRISRQRFELRTELLDIKAVVDAALETSRPVIEAAGHALTVSVPTAPLRVMGDPVRLEQVLSNLLNNAAKYTEDSGRIALTVAQDRNDIVISVRDNGIGIDEAMLPNLFRIFSQQQGPQGRSQMGLGIGLSLVQGLVELHGGSVHARSDGPGKGSEFIVRLPLAVDKPVEVAESADSDDVRQTSARYRIVIADDNRDGADSLAKLLQVMGHEVETAYAGDQAVEIAEQMRPDVILLDLGMPKVNGYEVCRIIRTRPWGREVVLIALTGWGQEEDRRRTREASFDLHLVKPVDGADLLNVLASVLGRGNN